MTSLHTFYYIQGVIIEYHNDILLVIFFFPVAAF